MKVVSWCRSRNTEVRDLHHKNRFWHSRKRPSQRSFFVSLKYSLNGSLKDASSLRCWKLRIEPFRTPRQAGIWKWCSIDEPWGSDSRQPVSAGGWNRDTSFSTFSPDDISPFRRAFWLIEFRKSLLETFDPFSIMFPIIFSMCLLSSKNAKIPRARSEIVLTD